MKTTHRLATLAAACTVVAAGLLGTAGTASAATPSSPRPHVAAVQDDGCTSGFTKGWTSVDLVIKNNGDVPLTYQPSLSGPSTGHWNRRPADVLQPGQCEIVNAYAPADMWVFYLNVVYSTPSGDYVPFSGLANSTMNRYTTTVFAGAPSYDEDSHQWNGTVDPAHSISGTDSGVLHTHYVLTFA
jgi:hypothetical protein